MYDTEAFLNGKEKCIFFLFIYFLQDELPHEIIGTLVRVCFLLKIILGEWLPFP